MFFVPLVKSLIDSHAEETYWWLKKPGVNIREGINKQTPNFSANWGEGSNPSLQLK